MNPSFTHVHIFRILSRGFIRQLERDDVRTSQSYPKVLYILTLVFLTFCLPLQISAQCSCSDGSTPLTRVESYSVIFPSNSTSNISMPQFNPAAGTLVCVQARVWLTSIVRLRLENEDNVTINYVVHYLRDDVFSGPGISPNVTGSRNKDYGPFTLGPADGTTGSGVDYRFIGPDTVYNKVLYEVTTSNVVNYLGTGSVNFQYKSIVPTYATGSDFYTLTVNSVNKLDFDLTYSYCANSVLASNIKNFTASLIDKSNVSLEWTTLNESKNNIYEIEVSENGKEFQNAGTTRAKSVNGTAAKYFYQYHTDKPAHGKLYFRLKQSAAGSARYSEIKSVIIGDEPISVEKLTIYPNPVVRNLVLDFNTPVTGDYQVQLTNQVGQVVYANRVKMSNNTILQLQLTDPPVPGIYYIRAVNTSTNKALSGKILFAK